MGTNFTRHLARFLAVQYFFTNLRAKSIDKDLVIFEPNALLSIVEAKKFDHKLYEDIIEGVDQELAQIDEIIQKHASLRPLAEMNIIDLIILRVGVWEGFIGKITPPKVVINECIELAKSFGNKENGAFVNGVLGSLYKELENEFTNG